MQCRFASGLECWDPFWARGVILFAFLFQESRAIERSFQRLAAMARVVDIVRRDERTYSHQVRSTILPELIDIEVDGEFGLLVGHTMNPVH